MPFAATWMQLEILIRCKLERKRQIPYGITYMWNLKYGTNERFYRIETDSQAWRTNIGLPREKAREWDALGVWG